MNIQQLNKQLEAAEKGMKNAEDSLQLETILKQYKGEDEVVSFKQYIKDAEGKVSVAVGKSNIPSLDTMIDAFHEGDLTVVTAPTGQGKTTLCQTLTKNFSKAGVKSLWFSYEVTEKELIDKFGDDLPDGYLPKVLLDRELVWIERKIVEGIAKFDTRVVFIDHLHYLITMKGMKQPSLEIGQLVRELKVMCKKYGIAMFLISHLTKTKFDEIITLDDIRDSSFIAQEADFVLTVQRITEQQRKEDKEARGIVYTDDARLSVAKNRRNGRLGSVQVKLLNGFFEEIKI